MSRNYKPSCRRGMFHNPEGLYFVDFAVVDGLVILEQKITQYNRAVTGIKSISLSHFMTKGNGKISRVLV